jgi:hypothetical protein
LVNIAQIIRAILLASATATSMRGLEMAFSKLKAHLRKIGARTFDQLFNAIGDICGMFMLELPSGCRICLTLNAKRFNAPQWSSQRFLRLRFR